MTPVLRGTTTATTSDAAAAPLLVLGPSLGTTTEVWSGVVERLADAFRVLRFDLPGHGISPAPSDAFTIEELAEAVVALVDAHGGGRFTYVGTSLGGAIGIALALGPAAGRLDGLGVVCSDARIGDAETWRARAEQVRRQGTASLVAATTTRWFSPGYPQRDPDAVGRALNGLVDVLDEGYARCCEALAVFDRRQDAVRIAVPTQVVIGDADPVVSAEDGERLAADVPHADLTVLAGTGHQAPMEQPERLAGLLRAAFAPAGRYEAGLAVRREVLSAPYVDASLAAVTPETADFQRFITEYAWGSVWTRPGLDRRLRSAVTISSLVTAHHWHELELHLRAGLRNGLSRDELTEILLQTAIYAGVPAANSAFGVLKRVLADQDGDDR